MKKKVFIILGIVAIVLVVAALVTSYADSARVRNSVEPVHTIKIVSEDGNKVTYWGLGYKVVRYPSVSPNEPYKNNRGVKYGSWFMDYELPLETTYQSSSKGQLPKINELTNFSDEQLNELFVGVSEEEIHQSYGEVRGILSGFWGDLYNLPDGEKRIIFYYNTDGKVQAVKTDYID